MNFIPQSTIRLACNHIARLQAVIEQLQGTQYTPTTTTQSRHHKTTKSINKRDDYVQLRAISKKCRISLKAFQSKFENHINDIKKCLQSQNKVWDHLDTLGHATTLAAVALSILIYYKILKYGYFLGVESNTYIIHIEFALSIYSFLWICAKFDKLIK